jgi:hypothetical protein
MQISHKQALLLQDALFQASLRIQLSKAAVNIKGEAQGQTPQAEYDARQALAARVLRGEDNLQLFAPLVLTDSQIESSLALADANLTALRNAVNDSDVNTRLGGVWTMAATA